jgi:hypothetical protein
VYLALARRADAGGWCYPSIGTIQADTGLSRKTTIEAIKALVNLGMVVVSAGPHGRGSHGYTLPAMATGLETTPVTGSENEPQPVQKLHSTGSDNEPQPVQKLHSTGSENEPQPVQKLHPNNTQLTTTKNNTQRTKRGKAAAVAVEIPKELESPEFQEAWSEWLQHRREIRKPATPTTQRKALVGLAAMGPARAIAAINHSVANGWQGIFEPNGESTNGHNGKQRSLAIGPGQRHPADTAARIKEGTF